MDWGDKRPWRVKFKLLLDRIDSLAAEGYVVGLVGASAGASAIINAYEARKHAVAGVVCIAGEINHPEAVGPRFRRKNRSFIESAEQCVESLQKLDYADRQRILSRYALYDELIPSRDSRIAGAHNQLAPSAGHFITIATQLLFGAPSFLRFLKKQASAV